MIIHKKMRRIKFIRTAQNFDNTLTTGKKKINNKMIDAKSVIQTGIHSFLGNDS